MAASLEQKRERIPADDPVSELEILKARIAELEQESERSNRTRHDFYAEWIRDCKRHAGEERTMLLAFTTASAANSAASCISRGYGRVKPRQGDRTYEHENGEIYLAFDIDEGDEMVVRRVAANVAEDSAELHLLRGTYVMKGASA